MTCRACLVAIWPLAGLGLEGECLELDPSSALYILVILVVAAYLVAAIPVGYLVGRALRGVDIRDYGTGNIGGSNVYHNVGKAVGVLVVLVCMLQGLWPVATALALGLAPELAGLVGIAAVIGYGWSVFLRFRGGRAIGVAMGALFPIAPLPISVLVLVFFAGWLLRRYALSMFVGFGLLPIYLLLVISQSGSAAIATAIFILLMVRRLEGIRDDFRQYPNHRGIFVDRLLHDRRPGQVLEGRRTPAA